MKKIKRVKLHSKSRSLNWGRNEEVPWLNVSGIWLKEAGFGINQKIEIIVAKNKLIIKPVMYGY